MTSDKKRAAPAGSPPDTVPGRTPVAVSWSAAATAYAVSAWFAGDTSTVMQVIATALVLVAVAGVPLLLAVGDRRSVLLAAIAGAIGVFLWILPLLVPGFGAAPWEPWAFMAALLHGLTARLAAFALRRAR